MDVHLEPETLQQFWQRHGHALEEARLLSRKVTEGYPNHPEGIKGAEATGVSIFLAHEVESIPDIRDYVNSLYYLMDFTLDSIETAIGSMKLVMILCHRRSWHSSNLRVLRTRFAMRSVATAIHLPPLPTA